MNNVYGSFDSKDPNALNINFLFVNGLESAKLESTIRATSFLLAVTTLHEYVHYGNNFVGFTPQPGVEMGHAFERAGFTVIIEKDNAGMYMHLYTN